MDKKDNPKDRNNPRVNIISILRRIRLSRRLLISSVLLPAVICLLIILLLSVTAYSIIRKNEIEHIEVTEDMIHYNLNRYLDSMITPLNALSTKTSFVSLVDDYNEMIVNNDWSRYTTKAADEIFTFYADNPEIYSIELIGTQASIAYFPSNITTGSTQTSELMNTLLDSPERIVSFGELEVESRNKIKRKTKKQIVIGVQIKSLLYSKVIGGLFISIDSEEFVKQLTMDIDSSMYNIAILTPEGNPIAARIYEDDRPELEEALWDLQSASEEFVKIKHSRYLMSQSKTDPLKWHILILINYDQMIRKLIQQIWVCIFIGILLVIVLLVVTYLISKSITIPINELVTAMETTEIVTGQNKLEPTGTDELTYLVTTYNEMSERINTLFLQNLEAQDQNRKIELDSLQAQINPHMLYNTLDSINWMAYLSGEEKICEIIQNLSSFYRLTLNQGTIFHSLSDELSQVECYLKLEQFVYNQAISYEIFAKEEIGSARIPRIILQPIVENAIMHGFASSELIVHIRVLQENGFLLLTVTDNGSGIPEIGSEEIPVNTINSQTGGYGLANIDERIKLIYGAEYGITMQNKKTRGLLVKVYLPEHVINDN